MSAANNQITPNPFAPRMPDYLLERAKQLFAVPSSSYDEKSMTIYIVDRLRRRKIPYTIDSYGNILVTKGTGTYPCFCAHLDTVHTYDKGFNIVASRSKKDKVTYLYAVDDNNKRVGIGGDDKCGVFACLYLLDVVENIKVVFFSREESGGIGSSHIALDFFKDCRFLAGIDRWNGNDFVDQYSVKTTVSEQFTHDASDIFLQYGYASSYGLFTDSFNVMERYVNISCMNLSCGYYQHHTDMEFVDTAELYNCCLLCTELATLTKTYTHKLPVYPSYKGTANNDPWDKTNNKYQHKSKTWKQDAEGVWYSDGYDRECVYCGKKLATNEFRFCTTCRQYYGDALDY